MSGDPVSLSNWGLKLWCCILSFTFISIIWLIPFCFMLFLVLFLFYNGKRYQQDPEFKWGDMGVTIIFYFLILLVAHLFLRIWDFLGIPIEHIMLTLSGNNIQQSSGLNCMIPAISENLQCCRDLPRFDSIKPIIDLMVGIIILLTKIISFVGTLSMIFFWGYSRYRHAKPAVLSGQGNIAMLIGQSVFAGFLMVIALSLIYYTFQKLLFFNISEILVNVIQCVSNSKY